jgi:2-oxoglutarate dehydrogenase E1 component
MDMLTYLGNAEIDSVDELYHQYKSNPDSVDFGWKKFFEGFEFSKTGFSKPTANQAVPQEFQTEFKVINLINGYRMRGHLFTKTNPVRERRTYTPTLAIENFGLAESDLNTVFQAGTQIGIGPSKLKDIIAHLQQTYCESIGVEYMYIRNAEIVNWLQSKMEGSKNTPKFSAEEKKSILGKLNEATVFENFLNTKFVGQKRFSIEGGETSIPSLDTIIETGAELGIDHFVVGMSHRGRLNVLANILRKPYQDIFAEFGGLGSDDSHYDGDVKYHQGYSNNTLTQSGKYVHLSLTPNPSHLEAVDPVVEGITRAKIDNLHKGDNTKVAPILIHGDAAIAGQGIVYEVIQMSQLDGYKTGGTIHLVINNQVGFTTNYIDARSSIYCTDVAKVVLSPVFHVNGDDVEALVFTCKMAMEFRQKFHKDVFIDILCYRKYGHNEGDEPRFTQPVLYKLIADHPNPREIYFEKLKAQGIVNTDYLKDIEDKFKELLQEKLEEGKQAEKAKITSFLEGSWAGKRMAKSEDFYKSPDTSVTKEVFLELAKKITTLPQGKKWFNKTVKLFKDREAMISNNSYDWGMAELMAYATLLNAGNQVRFSGQDVERGTFSHRHAVVKIEDSEEEYIPLEHLHPKQGTFNIYNSHLSEYGVLGFEYGYSMATPDTLTIWEAQFGDFFNGAQIMIDQFITCSENKWRKMTGLVMLLPHGYEGMGPEHSSARIERFLQLCADNNIQIANCSTPANMFHILRRQLIREFRKPLVVFTPKKLLRYPTCISTVEDFTQGGFKEIIDDATAQIEKVKTIVFCSGKIYYDLIERKQKDNHESFAIVRLEQIYPLPLLQLNQVIAKYTSAKKYIWAQEEPENMGAWSFLLRIFKEVPLHLVSRMESATPATGFSKSHDMQQKMIIDKVFEN